MLLFADPHLPFVDVAPDEADDDDEPDEDDEPEDDPVHEPNADWQPLPHQAAPLSHQPY